MYTIHEVPGTDPKMTYDSTVYTVKVSTLAAAGQLKATVQVEKNGVPYAGSITFTNHVDVPPTGDNIYDVMGLLLGASLLLMGGAYALSRKRREHG